MSGDISISGVQSNISHYKKTSIAAGVATLAAVIGGIVLLCFAIDDYYHASNLQDSVRELQNTGGSQADINMLQDQIDNASHFYSLNLGFSITLLALSLIGLGITFRQYKKKKENEGILEGQQRTTQPKEADDTSYQSRRKKAILFGTCAAICLVTFIILVSIAIDNNVKIGKLWDEYHKFHDKWKWHDGTREDWQTAQDAHEKIVHLVPAAWQEFGFSMGFLGAGLILSAITLYHYKEMKKEEGAQSLPPPRSEEL